jgi:pyruvate formate lyase activating enzyme
MEKEAMLYEKLDNRFVRCNVCAQRCKIADSKFGFCGMRQNINGILYTYAYGKVVCANVDPIEKKPFYHFLPGSNAFSIATIGCNFRCGFCQNWQISQSSFKNGSCPEGFLLSPQSIVEQAQDNNCKSISYTYTEPTVFFEYALETARLAKQRGLYNNFVTNGYMTAQALQIIKPYLDAANIDLKFFRDSSYKKICAARLGPVLETIRLMKSVGIWVEITTLIISGENDSEEELSQIAEFVAGIDKNIPWHISRFHPNYKFTDYPTTPINILKKAKKLGEKAGLRYIYLGNVFEGLDSHCYNCGYLLIKRGYFSTQKNNIEQQRCPACGVKIAGFFE